MIRPTNLVRAGLRYLETWWAPIAATLTLLAISGGALAALWTLGRRGVAPNAYLNLVASRGLGLLGLAVLAGCLASCALELGHRRWLRATRAAAVLAGTLLLMLPVTVLVSLVGTRAPLSVVYSTAGHSYYILTRDLVWTDTVYQIYRAPGTLWRPVWQRAIDPAALDYSEDGSLTREPRLLLSRDESLLVITRGGHKTDAIDLERSINLVGSVPWTAPDRQRRWRLRTAAIGALLEARGGSLE